MAAKTHISKEDEVWVIRLESPDGKVQEYRCASENQARQLATLLAPRTMAMAG